MYAGHATLLVGVFGAKNGPLDCKLVRGFLYNHYSSKEEFGVKVKILCVTFSFTSDNYFDIVSKP